MKLLGQSRRVFKVGPFSCRRKTDRRRIHPKSATCWSEGKRPHEAVIIEADTKGARLVIPWPIDSGQSLKVSYGNRLGLYRTEEARIAWAQPLGTTGQTIVGLYYEASSAA